MVSLEKRRKFLIDTPLMWYGRLMLYQADKVNVYESPLLKMDDKIHSVKSTVKERANYCSISYSYIISNPPDKEWETELSLREYNLKLSRIDYSKNRIYKSKYTLNFHNNMFDLDLFRENLLGLSILEVRNTTDKVLLPPHFKLIKDVSNDLDYSRENLFRINSYGNYSRFGKKSSTSSRDWT